jgi:hypothetical protein
MVIIDIFLEKELWLPRFGVLLGLGFYDWFGDLLGLGFNNFVAGR